MTFGILWHLFTDNCQTDAELAIVIETWDRLPAVVRAGIRRNGQCRHSRQARLSPAPASLRLTFGSSVRSSFRSAPGSSIGSKKIHPHAGRDKKADEEQSEVHPPTTEPTVRSMNLSPNRQDELDRECQQSQKPCRRAKLRGGELLLATRALHTSSFPLKEKLGRPGRPAPTGMPIRSARIVRSPARVPTSSWQIARSPSPMVVKWPNANNEPVPERTRRGRCVVRTEALGEARSATVRESFALAKEHKRWDLNVLARRLHC